MQQFVLVGAGRSHFELLKRLAKEPPQEMSITLVDPTGLYIQKDMIPGWMTGYCPLRHCCLDLRPLVTATGGRLIDRQAIKLDPDNRTLTLSGGHQIAYDYLSVEAAEESDTSCLARLDWRLLPLKPLTSFASNWVGVLSAARLTSVCRIVVIGGGKDAVEMALAAREGLRRAIPESSVTLITGGHEPLWPPTISKSIYKALSRSGIAVVNRPAVGLKNGVMASDGRRVSADYVIAANRLRPTVWLEQSGLALDADGQVCTDFFGQSVSHKNVIVIPPSRDRDAGMAHPFAALMGRAHLETNPRPGGSSFFQPPDFWSLDNGRALAMLGPWSVEGRWVGWWKRWSERLRM